MKTTLLRVAATLVATVSIALTGAAGVAAAEPSPEPSIDMIGGALDATPTKVTLMSTSTLPVSVAMVTDGPFTLDPMTFTIDPGETVTMTVAGEPKGRLSANLAVLKANVEGETSTVTLEVAFPQPAPPEFPTVPVLGGLLALATFVVVAYRVRRFAQTHTITRKEGPHA